MKTIICPFFLLTLNLEINLTKDSACYFHHAYSSLVLFFDPTWRYIPSSIPQLLQGFQIDIFPSEYLTKVLYILLIYHSPYTLYTDYYILWHIHSMLSEECKLQHKSGVFCLVR
jgi:hypothetical protein